MISKKTIVWSEISKVKIATSKLAFGLIYIDNDSIPELAVYCPSNPSYRGRFLLFTWKKGKVIQLGSSGLDGIQYYKKKGVYRIQYNGIRGVTYSYYKFSKAKSTLKLYHGGLSDRYKVGKNGKYTKISVSTFDAAVRKLTKGITVAEPTYYKNTKNNREKFLG